MALNLLLASNDFRFVETIEKNFSLENVNLQIISNGNDLLLTVVEKKNILLILDNQLGELLGYEILPVIKKVRPNLPIVFISDQEEYDQSKKVASSGVIARLLKPNDYSQSLFFHNLHNIVARYISERNTE